jgi:2-haloacid dehalogenase
MQTPKACFFDVFGTLVDWRTSIAREAEAILKPLGHRSTGWPSPTPGATNISRRWRKSAAGGWRSASSTSCIGATSNDLAALQDRGPVRGRSAHLNLAWHRLDAWPDSAGAGAAQEKCLIAPVSNGNISLMVDLARRNNFPWDAILGSEIAGDFKPKPRVYLAACEAFDLPPDDCMMVAGAFQRSQPRREKRSAHRAYREAERAWSGQGRAQAHRAGRCVRRRSGGSRRKARPLAVRSAPREQRDREVGGVMPSRLLRPEIGGRA